MTSKEQKILDKIVAVIKEVLNPLQIILFGSRAKGKPQKGSDFDVAIKGARPESNIERQLQEEIEDVCGLYLVDIVYLDEIDEDFREIIDQTGKVVYEQRN